MRHGLLGVIHDGEVECRRGGFELTSSGRPIIDIATAPIPISAARPHKWKPGRVDRTERQPA
jgi:hypothetical protein